MKSTGEVRDLLEAAARGRGAILSRRQFSAFDKVSASELKKTLQSMGRHADRCHGGPSREILRPEEPAGLGDAPAWIDSGAAYESFVEWSKTEGPPDHVICLDPWAGQLRGNACEIAPSAKWVLVSDLGRRKREGPNPEYWEKLEEWFRRLSFSAVVEKEHWDQALSAPDASAEARSASLPLYHQKPGAWQWRQVPASVPSATILFLVRYSGSLDHLRVFLDALVRQENSGAGLECILVGPEDTGELRAYLRWVGVSHPKLRIHLVSTSADWKSELNPFLEAASEAVLVMVGDHTVLPASFFRTALERRSGRGLTLPVSLEATAHILTGNLDAIAHYEQLSKSFAGSEAPRSECARIIPPEDWNRGQGRPAERILELARNGKDSTAAISLDLLELADFP